MIPNSGVGAIGESSASGHDFSRVSMGQRPTQGNENTDAGCPWSLAFGDQGIHEPIFVFSSLIFNRAESSAESTWALQAAEKLSSVVFRDGFVTGHDFSRAAKAIESTWALAPVPCTSNGSPENRSPFCGLPRLGITLLLFLAAALFVPGLFAQDLTLHVDVKLVSVFVNVTDKNGAIMGGLTRDDFLLTEDNRPQQIAVFERQSELPLNLTLAIDTSGSVRKDMTEEADAAKRFAHAILRQQDQMSLLQFATDVHELTPFTNKISQIDRGLSQLHGDYATALYDAIYLGSVGLGSKEGRKVLVLISDGGDTAKSMTYPEALEQALRNEVMIYSIIDVPIEASAGRDLGGEHALIALAEQTGGKSYYVGDGGLNKAFAQVSDDLRTQYLLGYYPAHQLPGTSFHRIQITVPRAAAQSFNIRHKSGYYADSEAKGN